MNHEFTEHHTLTSWSCRQCTQKFDSSEKFRQHIRDDHTDTFLGHQLDSIVTFSKSIEHRCDFGVQCPLCKIPLKGQAETDAKHIGTHLEEIALFILRSLSDISEGDEGTDEADVLGTQGVLIFDNISVKASNESPPRSDKFCSRSRWPSYSFCEMYRSLPHSNKYGEHRS